MEDAPFPDAEIIAVGSELLTPQRTDTNSLYLTGKLNDMGVEVVRKTIVGDDRRRLANVILSALESAKIVILTGGLGPTEDDVTRDAVALALGRGQTFRPEIADWLEQRFARAGRKMAEINKRQAFVIDGAIALANRNGTAPGQWIEHRDRIVMLLPGPPGELKPMFEAECVPRLEARLPKQVIRTRFYRVAGIAESDLDALIAPVYQAYSNPATTILAAPGDIQVHLRARARTEEEAEALLNQISPRIEELLGDRVYSRDGSPIEAVVGAMLRDRGATLAVAESCTGGMLGERITSVAGSSEYFAGGFLTYTDRMKTEVLGIDPALIEQFSAVSEPVAVAMAAAARKCAGASYALSVTGIAGPGGGTEATPVGTVFIGFAAPSREEAKRFHFHGDRERVRTFAVQNALEMLRRRLLAAQQSG
ncbi:MAG TPA: competence/damage-inducible protein A [Bryobacteraceae bacterium]|nr:competence/damage-inducible protein A [Bryobacteraceae bacterium]